MKFGELTLGDKFEKSGSTSKYVRIWEVWLAKGPANGLDKAIKINAANIDTGELLFIDREDQVVKIELEKKEEKK